MSSTPNPNARNGIICVVAALNGILSTQHIPRPAATENAINSTPAIPMPLCDCTALFHFNSEIQAYTICNRSNKYFERFVIYISNNYKIWQH